MKVLFAVGSDQLSRNIADRYYEKYGEVLEYKNVFFYKALLEEVKKNKTYDRIVINEMFEEIKSNDIERIDSFVFNNIDKITDEIQDAEIIMICADWRNAGDSFVSKLFSIGIYNMLLGNDRSLNPLCEIIKKPRNKRDAKQYLNIDTALITDSSITKENEVEENQVKSILSFYEGIKNQPEKYLETFDRVAEQYNRTQLKIIVEYLPKVVKDEIFKADRYKYLQPQVNVPQIGSNTTVNGSSTANVTQNSKPEVTKVKKHGFFSSLKKVKTEPASKNGTLDMSQMQASGRIDLSSNSEEQQQAELEAEARRKEFEERTKKAEEELNRQAEELAKQQAELEARARVEAEKRRQEELAAKAKAEVEARQQAELEAKARAEAAARQQAELEAKARAEAEERERIEKARAERQKQIELEAKARAEAAAKEQAKLAEKAKQEALAREQAMQAEKAKASENAKEQAELAARARAEAMARQQAELAAKAKAEATARANAGFTSSMTGGAEIPKGPGTLVEVKPNPKAPDRQIPKMEIPTPTVNVSQSAKIEKTEIDIDNKVGINKPNINVNPEPLKVEKNVNVQPEIKITTNSGVAPTKVNVEEVKKVENTTIPNVTSNVISNPTANITNNAVMLEQERKMKEEQEKLAAEQRKIKELQAKLEEEKRKLREEQEKFVSAQNQLRNEINNTTPQYSNNTLPIQTSPVANFRKMVVFVGANKVGTTFVTNAVAHNIASSKIKTSIIDMTRDRSLYYIYADESKAMKNRAAECMQRLSEGEDYYIETMNSHLKLYTSLAGSLSDQRRGYKHKVVIDTVKKNCNLTIVDADFTTPIDYFDQADEIYLVQDLDILKIQDVTLFLRELNARGLDKKKIRLIINRFVKTSITPKIIIGALDFYHDPAGTYVDSGLMPNKVDYSIIPYNLNNYAKYVESLHKMSGNFNYKSYSADFNQAIDEIVAKVYPKNHGGKRRFFG